MKERDGGYIIGAREREDAVRVHSSYIEEDEEEEEEEVRERSIVQKKRENEQ